MSKSELGIEMTEESIATSAELTNGGGNRSTGKYNFFMTSTYPDKNIKFHLPVAKLILQFEQFHVANSVMNWLNGDPSHVVTLQYSATGTWKGNVVGKITNLSYVAR